MTESLPKTCNFQQFVLHLTCVTCNCTEYETENLYLLEK